MAQKARKDLAKSNTKTLNNLHIGTLATNLLFLSIHFLFRRRNSSSLTLYFLFSFPAIICEYILETTGRPKYATATNGSTPTLKSAGEDLAAAGLTEYMFDVVWVTWASLVLVVLVGNWGWLLWAVLPAYGVVKGFSLFGLARGMAAKAQGQGVSEEQLQQQATPGNRRQRRTAA